MNLLQETLEDIDRCGHKLDDVDYFIITDMDWHEVWCDYDLYEIWCNDYADYDSGYGGQEVPACTAVVFKDSTWLERTEYDGNECFIYKEKPKKPVTAIDIEVDEVTGEWRKQFIPDTVYMANVREKLENEKS